MLNVTTQTNSAGAKSYFAQQSEYYLEGQQEFVGEWGGKGAKVLGLSGQVDKRAFDRLCDNIHPQTGKQLTKINRDGRRVGYDFTWSAPKSISVVHALTGDEAIVTAFRESVRETMSEMECEVQARVRKGKQDFDRTTGNFCYAEFVHLTSRPVNGVACPQLHVHAFTFNATHDSVENQWKAAQFGKLKEDAYCWQAVQQARFANKLQELGYSIRKTKDAFEIEGVPQSAIDKFSLRARLIDRVAEKLGITSAKIKAKLGATTREAKNSSIPYGELLDLWESQLTKEEAAAIGVVAQAKGPRRVVARDAAHAQFAIDHIFERSSVVDERRMLTLALRHGIGEVTPEGVRAEIGRHNLLRRQEAGKMWVTTKEVLAEETKMISFAAAGKSSCRPLAERGKVEIRDQRLNAGQRRAVEHVLTSADKVVLIAGSAGTGKTALTQEAVAQIEERGKSVVMLAPSAQASRGVLRDEGFPEADTLARFLLDDTMQAKAKDGFIWLDEAGLVGSPTLSTLFDVAERQHARVVLAGDSKQLASVERGAALRVLEDIAGLPSAKVTEIQRQQNADYKDAVKLLSNGRVAEGFDKLDAMGRVKLLPVWDSYEPVAREYADKLQAAPDKDRQKAVLIVCPTHAEGQRITAAVRTELKSRDVIAQEERDFDRLVPLQWTQAELADASRYTGEEVLQFHHNAGPFKAGQRVTASEALPRLSECRPQHFSAFAPASIALSPGETIRITTNGKTSDGKHKLNNGAVYQVAGFTKDGDISLTNGWSVSREFGHLSYGYVSTAHAAQGRTVEHVIVAQSSMSSPASTKENFYVAASRGKKSITVFCDDKRELKEAIGRSDPRLSATELAAKPKASSWQRARQAVCRFQQAAMIAAKRAAYEIREVIRDKGMVYER